MGEKTTKAGALNEGGFGYYKPDAIAGALANALYDQDRYNHTFNVREEIQVSQEELERSEHATRSKEEKRMIEDALNEQSPIKTYGDKKPTSEETFGDIEQQKRTRSHARIM